MNVKYLSCLFRVVLFTTLRSNKTNGGLMFAPKVHILRPFDYKPEPEESIDDPSDYIYGDIYEEKELNHAKDYHEFFSIRDRNYDAKQDKMKKHSKWKQNSRRGHDMFIDEEIWQHEKPKGITTKDVKYKIQINDKPFLQNRFRKHNGHNNGFEHRPARKYRYRRYHTLQLSLDELVDKVKARVIKDLKKQGHIGSDRHQNAGNEANKNPVNERPRSKEVLLQEQTKHKRPRFQGNKANIEENDFYKKVPLGGKKKDDSYEDYVTPKKDYDVFSNEGTHIPAQENESQSKKKRGQSYKNDVNKYKQYEWNHKVNDGYTNRDDEHLKRNDKYALRDDDYPKIDEEYPKLNEENSKRDEQHAKKYDVYLKRKEEYPTQNVDWNHKYAKEDTFISNSTKSYISDQEQYENEYPNDTKYGQENQMKEIINEGPSEISNGKSKPNIYNEFKPERDGEYAIYDEESTTKHRDYTEDFKRYPNYKEKLRNEKVTNDKYRNKELFKSESVEYKQQAYVTKVVQRKRTIGRPDYETIHRVETVKEPEPKAWTETLWHDFKDVSTSTKDADAEFVTKKNRLHTNMLTRQTYKVFSPDIYGNLPRVAEKYNFSEPIPERDREHENLKDIPRPPSSINKKVFSV